MIGRSTEPARRPRRCWPGKLGWCLSLSAAVAAVLLCGATGLAADPPPGAAWDERLAASLHTSLLSGRVWVALLAAWVGGLLTSFTPCVWPLIPITVRFFASVRGSGSSRGRVVRLALVYVAGMSALYATLGVLFASSGKLFGSLLASPWVAGAFALFCAAMGLSMLGAFTLQLPSSLNTRLSQVGGSSLGGALLMGLVSGLIAAPCTGPVLAVVLALIASTGQVLLGFWLMVSFSLGLGLPFLVLAIVSGRKLPQSGVWMDVVKTVLAAAMFSVAVYFLVLALPVIGTLVHAIPAGALLGLLVVAAGLAVGAATFNLHDRPVGKVAQAATVLCLTVGVTLAMMGSRATRVDPGVPGIKWLGDHDVAMARARAEGLPVIIDFTADWCAACKELEHKTYVDQRVRAEATRFVTVMIDATRETDAITALFERYGVLGLPAVIFIDSEGKILDQPRVTGFVPPERFLQLMQQVH